MLYVSHKIVHLALMYYVPDPLSCGAYTIWPAMSLSGIKIGTQACI
ncbi:MAG: hypothetical protein ACI8TV_001550 [Porticoccaceae bacterium]|jgi:hypothetical protein